MLAEYLQGGAERFHMFGASHVITLIITVLGMFLIPYWGLRMKSEEARNRLGLFLAWMVTASYLIWITLELISGRFDIRQHLPFHLCRVVALLLPVLYYTRNPVLFQVLFYWGFSAMLQATITPADLTEEFPHFYFLRFMVAHPGALICLAYTAVVMPFRPNLRGLFQAWVAINALLVLAALVNVLLDANYLWIFGKPPGISILTYLGPWPWYLLGAQVVAVVNFYLVYIFYSIIYRIGLKISESK